MKRVWIATIISICAGLAAAAPQEEGAPGDKPADKKFDKPADKTKAPFYDKYLTDEDPGDRAIRDLTRQIGEKPEDPALHNDLGNLLARRGFAKEAVQQYRQAQRLERHSYLPSYNEGLLWEKEGKPQHAMSAFRRSIRLKPGFPFSHFHLGVLEERAGREPAAVNELAKALRIDNSLRLPSRNPLAVQTRLLQLASVANYQRDLASAVLVADGEFIDPSVLARLSPERPIDSREVVSAEKEEEAPPSAAPAAIVPLPSSQPSAPGAPRSTPNRERPNRSRSFGRPRTQFPPQQAIPPPALPQPPPAAEPAPEEPPQETPPPQEEEPPPPGGR